nr:hypothetical protein [Microctonus hyperodae filamentous virus]
MSQVSKHVFAGEELEVVTIIDDHGEKWFLANPFAHILGYSNVNRAIRMHVSKENRQTFDAFKCKSIEKRSKQVQAQSKFINREGIFELINASKMPKAEAFRKWWVLNILPSLETYPLTEDVVDEVHMQLQDILDKINWKKKIRLCIFCHDRFFI